MYDGLEIDMLSLGDADCIVVTQYPVCQPAIGPQRVLIDGGKESDAPLILDFLRSRNMTNFWAVVCTHLHNDHARGLIKIVQHPSISIQNAWMHDIRGHVLPDALRRASSGNSAQADAVRQVLENTRELASALARHQLTTREPFSYDLIAGYPQMVVLGPSEDFYAETLREFTEVEESNHVLAAMLGASRIGVPPRQRLPFLAPPPEYSPIVPTLSGFLQNSSVKKNPTTQPFNNTSTILGATFRGQRLLLTADAGSRALDRIPAEWRNLIWLQIPHHGSDGNLSQSNIERFCPKFAYVSATGDTSHPSKAIVNGLIKLGAQVFSTHKNPNHLLFFIGNVPPRADYGPAVPLKGTVETVINLQLLRSLYGTR
jgi:beta-lactamase superfamily II metal-dependent hydrolase